MVDRFSGLCARNKVEVLLVTIWVATISTIIWRNSSLAATLFLVSVIATFAVVAHRILVKEAYLSQFQLVRGIRAYLSIGLVLIFIFVYAFLERERFVYFWDYSAYWTSTINYTQLIYSHFATAIRQIYISVLNDDYSVVPSVVLSLGLHLLGTSYSSYVLSVLLFYLLPTFTLLVIFGLRIISDLALQFTYPVVLLSIILLFPPLLSPALSGYVDSMGLVVIVMILAIVYGSDLTEWNTIRNVTLTFLLLLLAFTRRWYGFWIVSFFFALPISSFIRFVLDRRYSFNDLVRFLYNIIAIGGTSIIVLVLFFRKFVSRSLFNNYGITYSAYKSGGFFTNVNDFVHYFGWLFVILAIIGVFFGVKVARTRYFSIFFLIQGATTFFLFLRIQSFAIHQYYLVCIPVVVFSLLGSYGLINLLRFLYYRHVTAAVLTALFILNFSHSYFVHPPSITNVNPLRSIFSSFIYYPLYRSDMTTLRNLDAYLNELTAGNDSRIYVLASSGVLNSDLLMKLNMPDEMNAVESMDLTHDVDKRDGFPTDFLDARYVVVGNPIQYSLAPSDQQVVGIFAKGILTNDLIGRHYRLLKTFLLENDVKANVYEKTSPFDKQTLQYIRDKFQKSYPSDAMLNSFSDFPGLMYQTPSQAIQGGVEYDGQNNQVILSGGSGHRSSFALNLDQGYTRLSFVADALSTVSTPGPSKPRLSVYLDGKLYKNYLLTHSTTCVIPLHGAREMTVVAENLEGTTEGANAISLSDTRLN